ncbi:MAG: carbohydrate kinase family protein [Streptosporangiaceae bacterium]
MSAAGAFGATVTVIGEALIDLVPGDEPLSFRACPGGSPYNVAIGLARLGHDTVLMARLADNAFGRILRRRAAAEGIRLDAAPQAHEPTTLAVVSLDEQARASYDFYIDGTADWQWTAAEAGRIPADTAVLHFGSLASWTPPGDERISELAQQLRRRGDALVSYDPNVRPGLLGDPGRARPLAERSAGLAHLVKASAEDIGWLYPGRSAAEVAGGWLELGATVVVITDGDSGADTFTAAGPALHCPAQPVAVADTVGAGDSFTAGLLASLIRRGLHHPARLAASPAGQLSGAVRDAIAAAAVTCQRPGADPPAIAELGPGWGQP